MGLSRKSNGTGNEVERFTGFTQSQIDTLDAMFKEKENQE